MAPSLTLNLTIDGLSVLLLVFLFVFVHSDGENRVYYRGLKRLLIATLICIVLLIPSHFYAGHPEWNQSQLIFTILSTAASVLLYMTFAWFLFEVIEQEYDMVPPLNRFVPLLSGLYVLFAFLSVLLGDVSCNEEGYLVTRSGVGISLLFGMTLFLYLTLFFLLVRYHRAFEPWEIALLSLFFLVPLYLNLRMEWSDAPIYAFYVIEELYLFLMICSKRTWEMTWKERELAEKNLVLSELRGRSLLSQIQPEFLESSLLSIADLCETKPWEAREVTVDFADFLRGNLRAVRESVPVFFSWELEQIELYLSVERARLGDKAKINNKVGPMNFRLAPLSVQPLVGYAIQQGGTVTLSTERKEGGWTVMVLSEKTETNSTADWNHFDGFSVIKARLWEQVRGTIRVYDRPGKWSRVVLFIPDEVREEVRDGDIQ